MLQIGIYHTLEILRLTPPGLFLGDGDKENEVLLPNKYIPKTYEIGDKISVFVYQDFDERVVATTLVPKIELNKFAVLEMKENSKIGAFMNWGLEKDLLVPFSEQKYRMRVGGMYLIHMYFDEVTGRLVGTQKVRDFVSNNEMELSEGEEVEIIIADNTKLGVNVIINQKYEGLIYHDEVFGSLAMGQTLKAYVKKIREHNKVDISLQKLGYVAIDGVSQKILETLKQNNGFLGLTDNSAPDDVYDQMSMSKKTFKKAIGLLYKQKLIVIEEKGIRLVV